MNEKQAPDAASLRAAREKAGRGPNRQIAAAVKERVATWVAARVAEEIQQRMLASALGPKGSPQMSGAVSASLIYRATSRRAVG